MAATQRLSPGWLIAAACAALAGLAGLGFAMTWFTAMLAPDTIGLAFLAAGAALAAIALAVAIPLLHRFTVPVWARWAVPLVLLPLGIAGAVGTWVLSVTLVICEANCVPADTWKMLPILVLCGVQAATGPGVGALAAQSVDARYRWWVATALVAVAAFAVGMYFWVEGGIFPAGM